MGFEGSILDIGLHVVTVIVSLVLLAVSSRAYQKKRTRKFGFIVAAFGTFALKELILVVNIVALHVELLEGVAHLLNLVILGLFFYGVVR